MSVINSVNDVPESGDKVSRVEVDQQDDVYGLVTVYFESGKFLTSHIRDFDKHPSNQGVSSSRSD